MRGDSFGKPGFSRAQAMEKGVLGIAQRRFDGFAWIWTAHRIWAAPCGWGTQDFSLE